MAVPSELMVGCRAVGSSGNPGSSATFGRPPNGRSYCAASPIRPMNAGLRPPGRRVRLMPHNWPDEPLVRSITQSWSGAHGARIVGERERPGPGPVRQKHRPGASGVTLPIDRLVSYLGN